jgi:predicted RND superfamily exporter protein/lauroyl/myristoyl acyltransferase
MKFRWWWLFFLAAVGIGIARLHFDTEVLDLLPANVRAVAGLKLYQEHFNNARELIITVQGDEAARVKTAAQQIAEQLRTQTNLISDVTWQPPWQEHPEQTAELIAYLWLNQPPEVFSQLGARLAETNLATVLATTRDDLANTLSPMELAQSGYDPYGLTQLPASFTSIAGGTGQGEQLFASASGTFRILFVQSRQALGGYQECTAWLAAVKRTVNGALPAGSRVQVGYTGRPAFVVEISASMKHDIMLSTGGTSVIIAVLFWLAHRRLKPMLWLLALLALILASTLALGGLVFGTVSVISMGFAAILLGLAVDYAVVHYQEAIAQPELSIPEVRRAIAPAIFWAAVTTISAFFVLNFGGLPGLAQLGSLVGIGVALSACVMIFAFLPPLFPDRMQPHAQPSTPAPRPAYFANPNPARAKSVSKWVFVGTVVLLLTNAVILSSGLPKVDASADALQPRNSPAYASLNDIKANLSQKREPLWLVIQGRDEAEVARRLDAVEPILEASVTNGTLTGFTSPDQFWPRPAFQSQNRATAAALISERAAFHAAALTDGFSAEALGLTDEILATWQRAAATRQVFWPTNPLCTWIFEKLAVRETNQFFAAAFLYPATNTVSLTQLESQMPKDGVWLSSWELLGGTVLAQVKQNLWKLLPPMIGLVLLSLWLAFRRPLEIFLSLGVLLLSGLCLLSIMKLSGWSWNLIDLMALPLMLGTGVDYGIFMQLALRRHGGDLRLAYQSVGRALLLCGGTAIAGFGSLGLSSNAGMASLGRVCAVGIAGNMLFSIFLLPVWWSFFVRHRRDLNAGGDMTEGRPAAPSQFYQAGFWRLGLLVARTLPGWFCSGLAAAAAAVYWRLAPHRRETVIENLAPIFPGDPAAAVRTARYLFTEFALKLVDLWRYESGITAAEWYVDWRGWEIFNTAQARGRGVLLVTPHLGNWELGGAFMAQHGCKLLVLTQDEPDPRLTAMRQASRARWGVETLVVGKDAFAIVEIIKRLQAGATVALLVDRPPAPTAAIVQLFGRDFAASIAAAELARASGCAIIPTLIVREPGGYRAQILPEITYARAAIGNREERLKLTQEILRAFEPVIRQYAAQWYHFVPIWPPQKK